MSLRKPLLPDVVHLRWLSVPQTADDEIDRWLDQLDAEEKARAARFRFPGDKAAYVSAHALLRHMLTAVTGESNEWQFRVQRSGKPELAAEHGFVGLHFNISHTSDFVACAVAPFPVGVDVETVERKTDFAISRRFAARERATLAGVAPDAFALTFFRLWTLKEAYLKGTGDGLSRPLDSFTVELNPPRLLFTDPGVGRDADAWRFFEFMPRENRPLALAFRPNHQSPVTVQAEPLAADQIA